jgi:rhamnosyltransferase
MNIAVVVPTLNAAVYWPRFSHGLLSSVAPEQVLVVDSQSTDGTLELAQQAGFRTHSIARSDFSHGGTRQLAARMLSDADILIYLTQDAIVADPAAIPTLASVFADPQIGAAYGRQMPRPEASAIERHARHFNYPETPQVRELSSRRQLGIKAIFFSNSFAAYRRSTLLEVGGFPADIILGEDTVVAAHLLKAGYHIAYVPRAWVYHSHPYSWKQEFKRYFDIGVLHARERWLLDEFGTANGEGRRFIQSELDYLLENAPLQIPSAFIRTGLKLVGYRLGRMERNLPPGFKTLLSMHSYYWTSKPIKF